MTVSAAATIDEHLLVHDAEIAELRRHVGRVAAQRVEFIKRQSTARKAARADVAAIHARLDDLAGQVAQLREDVGQVLGLLAAQAGRDASLVRAVVEGVDQLRRHP